MYVEGGNKKDENALIVIHSTRGKEGLDCLFFILHLPIFFSHQTLYQALRKSGLFLMEPRIQLGRYVNSEVFCHPQDRFLEGTAAAAAAKSRQFCPTLCDPIDGSPPGSFVPGISQARVLEWGAIAFSSRGHRREYLEHWVRIRKDSWKQNCVKMTCPKCCNFEVLVLQNHIFYLNTLISHIKCNHFAIFPLFQDLPFFLLMAPT